MKNSGKISPSWLKEPHVQHIFDVLEADGGEARIVGGAVRNFLLGAGHSDIDFATTVLPEDVVSRFQTAGDKAIPTGIEHGTVTVVVDGNAAEITTLREDIETDGRHAKVAFGRDFEEDAKRRDFTINALYVDRNGVIDDHADGLGDIDPVQIRFIGDAGARIEEDYLRILRFFRFFAEYGKFRPDSQGLKACARLKDGLRGLSAERVWTEMRKLLGAQDPSRALLWMRQVSVLTLLLPESEKWGIDAIPALIDAESRHGWEIEPEIRLMGIIPSRQETVNDVAKRWKLSNKSRDRLRAWAALPKQLPKDDLFLQKLAYRHSKSAVIDGLKIQAAMQRDDAVAMAANQLASWQVPQLPLKGSDLLAQGFDKGPSLGGKLKEIETAWVESGFSLSREQLLKQL